MNNKANENMVHKSTKLSKPIDKQNKYHSSNSNRFHRNHKEDQYPRRSSKTQNNNNNVETSENYSWDFDELAIYFPPLSQYVFISENGCSTIDWKNPKAHKTLNQAILAVQFGIKFWDMPEDQLIPAIPSRLLYLDWIHKILGIAKAPSQQSIKGVDIGTGASLIYPILGFLKYNWRFIATEIHEDSIKNAQLIIQNNNSQSLCLKDKIEVRQSTGGIIKDVIMEKDGHIDFVMCNPPFFSEHAEKKQWTNVNMKMNEYITEGGEIEFIKQMFMESIEFKGQIRLFTSLIGKQKDFHEFNVFIDEYIEKQKSQRKAQENKQLGRKGEGDKTLENVSEDKQNEDQKGLFPDEKIQKYNEILIIGNTTRWIIGWSFQQQISEVHKKQ